MSHIREDRFRRLLIPANNPVSAGSTWRRRAFRAMWLSNVAAFPLIFIKTACKLVSFDDGHFLPASFVVPVSLADSGLFLTAIIVSRTDDPSAYFESSSSTLSKSHSAPSSKSSLHDPDGISSIQMHRSDDNCQCLTGLI
ncbi:hypothetical protein OG21DRAFT_852218 [Imleria badia]|nr:hypothetical protein OG21DRAFT_852218 [Imleria badia]